MIGSTLADSPDGKVPGIRFAADHTGDLLLSAILQGLAVAVLAVPLAVLYLATLYRRPETARLLRILVIAAPLLYGALFVARQLVLNTEIKDVIPDLEGLNKDQAEDLIDDRLGETKIAVIAGLAFAAQLAAGAAVMLTSNYARRAGLMSNFLGILGIIVGVLIVLPLFGSLPIVQLFWLGALAALFLGRWPGGRGPAWETGEADPWPTAQELRERRLGVAEASAEPEEDDDDEPDEGADPVGPAHPRSKKRKRKRRR